MPVGRQRLGTEDAVGAAAEVGDAAAGLAHDQRPGGDVPRPEAPFPVAVDAAAGEPAQVERRRATAAYALAAQHEFADDAEIEVGALAPIVRRAGGEQRLLQCGDIGYTDRGAVELGTAAAHRGEGLVAQR